MGGGKWKLLLFILHSSLLWAILSCVKESVDMLWFFLNPNIRILFFAFLWCSFAKIYYKYVLLLLMAKSASVYIFCLQTVQKQIFYSMKSFILNLMYFPF